MNQSSEEASSAIALVRAVRESLDRSRDPAHFCGLIRGLDIGLSMLADLRDDPRGGLQQLRERWLLLDGVDAYQEGVACGLRLTFDLATRVLASPPEYTVPGGAFL